MPETPIDSLTTLIDESVRTMLIQAKGSDSVKDLTSAIAVAIKWHDSKKGVPSVGLGAALGGGDDR